jgi:hypothetical protein
VETWLETEAPGGGDEKLHSWSIGPEQQPPPPAAPPGPSRVKRGAQLILLGVGGAMVLGAIGLAGSSTSWWPWLGGIGVCLLVTAVIRRRVPLGWIGCATAIISVTLLASTSENVWWVTVSWSAVFGLWCVGAMVLARSVPAPAKDHPRSRRASSIVGFVLAWACLLAAGLFGAWTVRPGGNAMFLPGGANCGSALLPPMVRTGGPGVPVPLAHTLHDLATSDCAYSRHAQQGGALVFAGWGAVVLAISFVLSRSSPASRGTEDRQAGSRGALPWSYPRLAAATLSVPVVVLMIAAVLVPRTLDLASTTDAGAVTTGVCQALTTWSASVTTAVNDNVAKLRHTQSVAVQREGVIALTVTMSDSFDQMLARLRALGQTYPNAGPFLTIFTGPLSDASPRLRAIVGEAGALPDHNVAAFDNQKRLISTQITAISADIHLDPDAVRALPTPDALLYIGAMYGSPARQPILDPPATTAT